MAIATSVRAKDGGLIPGPANVPNVIEFKQRFTLANAKVAHVVFHAHYTTAPSNIQTLVDGMFISTKSAFTTNLASFMPTTVSYSGLGARDMTSFQNAEFEAVGAPAAGTGTEDALPEDVAAVLTENVTVRGRGVKGRMYIPGWSELANGAPGQMSAGVQAALNAYGTALTNAITAQNLTPCVAKPARQEYIGLTGTHHNARTATFAPITSFVCKDLEWDTQRRRGR